jgi:PAS domain S-box-containing protein
MLKPLIPANEIARLQVLRDLNILDTPAEERFDRLTRIAQHILQVPIALVSLVDAQRQWFKSRQGLDTQETHRDISFCGHAILGSDVFVVADAAADPRFADNPLVLEAPSIRFYAGAPLTLSSGERVGTLCAIDRQPHQVTSAQLAALQDLAACVVEELEQARQRQDAKKSAQLVESIVETVIDGIITIDSKGTIQSFNSAAERLFGYKPAEIIGSNVNRLMPQPYAAEHDGYLAHFHETREARVIGIGREVVGKRKDGAVFPMDLAVSEMQQPGQTLFVGIVRDITERKRVDQMKVEFVATVSHELRTPLTSISGALGLICGGALGPVSEQAKTMLDIAYRNSQRLTLFINDLLDMEKLAAGKMRFNEQTVALMPLVEQSIESTRAYAQQYQVNLLLVSRLEGVQVTVDGSRLQQVLSNFLSNAAKFSPKGGQIEIKVDQLDSLVRVSVQDHGPGIPADFIDRIFHKFSQADSSNTRHIGGTGLGLAISKELIERMNGTIGFSSVPGSGACFYFDLPISTNQCSIDNSARTTTEMPHES